MVLKIEQIRVALQIALLGEIYQAIRAVVFEYTPQKNEFILRYYLDRQPVEDDFESISEVMAEFIANFNYSTFENLKEECEFSELPKSKLEPLSGFVYLRKEPS